MPTIDEADYITSEKADQTTYYPSKFGTNAIANFIDIPEVNKMKITPVYVIIPKQESYFGVLFPGKEIKSAFYILVVDAQLECKYAVFAETAATYSLQKFSQKVAKI